MGAFQLIIGNVTSITELIKVDLLLLGPGCTDSVSQGGKEAKSNSICLAFVLRSLLTKNLERPQSMHNLIICIFSRILYLLFSASLLKGISASEVYIWPMNLKHQALYVN